MLLLAEGAARLRPAELRGGLHELHVYSETYGWTPRPGFRGRFRGQAVTINARGYRGRQHETRRVPGRRRVLLLGDSITFGYAVADEHTFGALLDARPGLEAVNLAVEGYGTGQQLLKLRHEGLAYRPDDVLLNVCVENDVVDNARSAYLYERGFRQPWFTLGPSGLELHDAHLRLSTLARWRLALETRSRLAAWLRPPPPPEPPGAGARWRQAKHEVLREPGPALRLTFALILAAQREAATAGARFGVVLHPNKRALQGRVSLIGALHAAPELAGVPRLNLAPHYAARGLAPGDIFVDGSGHLDARGHAVAAEVLSDWLTRELR